MLIPTLITIAVVIALFIIVVMLRPNDFRVSRSVKVAASASQVFEQVNDLHRMNAWNTWLKMDTKLQQTYEGAASGGGAVYSWDGNRNVGAGRQTIAESRPNELVRLKLEFLRPFASVNEVTFTLAPDGDQITVTWSMIGQLNFITKAMGLFCSMDKMCGNSFEEGLADMKAIVEKVSSFSFDEARHSSENQP